MENETKSEFYSVLCKCLLVSFNLPIQMVGRILISVIMSVTEGRIWLLIYFSPMPKVVKCHLITHHSSLYVQTAIICLLVFLSLSLAKQSAFDANLQEQLLILRIFYSEDWFIFFFFFFY